MGVSTNGGTPVIIHFRLGFFPYKPSIQAIAIAIQSLLKLLLCRQLADGSVVRHHHLENKHPDLRWKMVRKGS